MLIPAEFRKLRHKLISLLSIGIVSVGLIAFYSLSLLSEKIDRYGQLIEKDVAASSLASSINLNFKRQVQEWKNVLLRGHTEKDRDKYWRQFLELQNQIQRDAEQFLSLPVLPEFTSQMQDFKRQHQGLLSEYQKGYDAFVESGFSHTVGDQAVRGIDRAPTRLLESLAEKMQSQTETYSQNIADDAGNSVSVAIIAILVAVIASTLFSAVFMGKKVVQPITALINLLRGVSRGNYTKSLVFEGSDEIASMSRAIERLRLNLASVNSEFEVSKTGLSAVSDSLKESATAISDGVNMQNSGTDDVTRSMYKMNEMANRVAHSATEAATQAEAMQLAAKESQTVMLATIDTIKGSSAQIQDTAQVIQSLDEDVKNVSSVIDVIQSIAEQTNLLALNAAIEAARAGEQGRGFAVVADEVRTLASRTQQSTEEIQQIIGKLQTGAQNAVNAISQGEKHSSASVEKVIEADANIQKVSSAIDHISKINHQIATAISEQSHLSEQITDRLDALANIAKLNRKHADSCSEDNRTLAQIRNQMEGAIDQLQGKGST